MGSIDKACISGFLCRLCSEMHRIVIHIYGDQGQRLCLVEKINGYLPITISPTDPLPKTICTTCLRRVEQHYDLLMRLSRIKEERFLRGSSKRPRVTPISSIENSEDEVYQSDDESRRRRGYQDTPAQRRTQQSQHNLLSSAPTTSSSTSAVLPGPSRQIDSTTNPGSNVDSDDDDSGTSASAGALVITENATDNSYTTVGDSSSASSSSPYLRSIETGNSYGIVLQQQSD